MNENIKENYDVNSQSPCKITPYNIFTGLKELQNHPHKAGFDIGSKNLFTAKIGELLPLYWDVAIPNCDYDIDLAYFTRTRPVQTAAYKPIVTGKQIGRAHV